MGADNPRGPMGDSPPRKRARKPREEVKGEFVRTRGWYVPSLHEKYLKAEEGV